jgi:hypothetical protein
MHQIRTWQVSTREKQTNITVKKGIDSEQVKKYKLAQLVSILKLF